MSYLIIIVLAFALTTFLARKEIAKSGNKFTLSEVVEINLSSLLFRVSEKCTIKLNVHVLGLLNWLRVLLLILFFIIEP